MFAGVVLFLGSAGGRSLSLKEELIAIATGNDYKLRGLQPPTLEGVLYP